MINAELILGAATASEHHPLSLALLSVAQLVDLKYQSAFQFTDTSSSLIL